MRGPTLPPRHDRRPPRARRAGRGATLIELVVAIAVAGLVVTGTWAAWTTLQGRSADPLAQRQALAVAESLLAEIQLRGTGSPSGAGGTDRRAFTAVQDYHGLALDDGITDIDGTPIPGLAAYRARVSVTPRALHGVPADGGWWIEVRVTGPQGGAPVVLAGWRSAR